MKSASPRLLISVVLVVLVAGLAIGLRSSSDSLQGQVLTSSSYDLAAKLLDVPPLPNSDEVSAFSIIDVLGVNIKCPRQIDLLSQIQIKLSTYNYIVRIYKDAQKTQITSSKNATAIINQLVQIKKEIEALIEQIAAEKCDKPEAFELPESFDVRFLEDYLQNIPVRCKTHREVVESIRELVDTVKRYELELSRAKSDANKASYTNLIKLTLKRIREEYKKLAIDCPKDEVLFEDIGREGKVGLSLVDCIELAELQRQLKAFEEAKQCDLDALKKLAEQMMLEQQKSECSTGIALFEKWFAEEFAKAKARCQEADLRGTDKPDNEDPGELSGDDKPL